MKILVHYDSKSGSDWHRLGPLRLLKADYVDKLTTELVKNYDILWINRSCKMSSATLSLWRDMFGIRIIYDMDDSLVIPDMYPGSKAKKEAIPLVIDKIREADWITCSTVEVYKEVIQYNENANVIPNRIRYEDYPCEEETYEQFCNRKIRVGFIGAYTHYNDWKSIKGWMNTLVTRPEFIENCEFYMGGYNKGVHQFWKEFSNLGTFIPALPTHQYLELFKKFDIILCPLEDNQLNRAKSSLRLLEAGVHNCVCILSPLYESKSDVPNLGHLVAAKEKDWLTIPLMLIDDRKSLWELKLITGKSARSLDFNRVIEQRIDVANKVLSLELPKTKHQIWNIKYDENQPTQYPIYFNKVNTVEDKSYLFEYNPILDIVPKTTEGFVGVFSWKFPLKTLIGKKKLEYILDNNQSYDCINFCKPLGKPYLKFTEEQHKGFMKIFYPLCQDLGIVCREPKNVIYSNFFVLKSDLYKEYIETILKPAIELLETDYKDLVWKDAGYKSGLPAEKLKQFTGLDYYTFHTFILERLISVWIEHKKIKTLNVFKK